ncbi:MAG: hypothetical protein KGJ88_09110 [Verrucomicrobiota bacterium]|nr:hypothetical protein [Verrucomicrobiota bacterium]
MNKMESGNEPVAPLESAWFNGTWPGPTAPTARFGPGMGKTISRSGPLPRRWAGPAAPFTPKNILSTRPGRSRLPPTLAILSGLRLIACAANFSTAQSGPPEPY